MDQVSRSPFDRLPDELVVQIFRYVAGRPPPRAPSHALVSRRWRRLAYLARTALRLHDREISPSQVIDTLRRTPNVTGVIATSEYASCVTDEFLAAIARACQNLAILHLDRPPLSSEGLSAFFQAATNLEKVSLCMHQIAAPPAAISSLSKLACLRISSTSVTRLPDEIGQLKALRALHLKASRLESLPDAIGDLSNLETLDLKGCRSLARLPESIDNLVKLTSLVSLAELPDTLCFCTSLARIVLRLFEQNLPPAEFYQLPSLRSVTIDNFSGDRCEPLSELPQLLTHMSFLQHLSISAPHIESLPEDLGNLSNLRRLKLDFCLGLTHLPDSLAQLSLLECLVIGQCCQFRSLPESIGQLSSLRDLRLRGVPIESLPDSVGQLSSLRDLRLRRVPIKSLPDSVGQLSSLRDLRLRRVPIESLPDSVGQLQSLISLELHGCALLRLRIPDSLLQLSNLQWLGLYESDFTSLPSNLHLLTSLRELALGNCHCIQALPLSLARCPSLRRVTVSRCTRLVFVHKDIQHLVVTGNKGKVLPTRKGCWDDEEEEEWWSGRTTEESSEEEME